MYVVVDFKMGDVREHSATDLALVELLLAVEKVMLITLRRREDNLQTCLNLRKISVGNPCTQLD